jgi:hypothetical protein
VYGVKPPKDNDIKWFDKSSDNPHDALRYHQAKGDLQCMDNSVRDTAWLKKTAGFFESDLILSINQFEIKTNYKSCLDIANKVYRREVHVHYTLMDASGKSMQGNIAIGAFPSNSNRVEEIAEMVFPEIASYIAAQLQGPVR